jgi:hypothetical protein
MKTPSHIIAKQLFESGLSVQDYESLQAQRKARLDFWLDRRIKVIAEGEMKLISDGDEVLQELKKLIKGQEI